MTTLNVVKHSLHSTVTSTNSATVVGCDGTNNTVETKWCQVTSGYCILDLTVWHADEMYIANACRLRSKVRLFACCVLLRQSTYAEPLFHQHQR